MTKVVVKNIYLGYQKISNKDIPPDLSYEMKGQEQNIRPTLNFI